MESADYKAGFSETRRGKNELSNKYGHLKKKNDGTNLGRPLHWNLG